MSKKQSPLSVVLKHLSKAAESLTEDEIAEIAAGRRRLILSTEEVSLSRAADTASEQSDFTDIIANLRHVETRESAHRLIQDASLTRSQLTQLAKALDLPVSRNDDVERLQEKIVETTIGFRITSNAIHKNG
jgi:hypothetical protein